MTLSERLNGLADAVRLACRVNRLLPVSMMRSLSADLDDAALAALDLETAIALRGDAQAMLEHIERTAKKDATA